MWKDVAIIGVAAALGEYGARKFGTAIEAKAVSMKVPVAIAHATVVGSAAVVGFLIVKAVWK